MKRAIARVVGGQTKELLFFIYAVGLQEGVYVLQKDATYKPARLPGIANQVNPEITNQLGKLGQSCSRIFLYNPIDDPKELRKIVDYSKTAKKILKSERGNH